MESKERCELCRFFESNKSTRAGWCRRYPPQVYGDTHGGEGDIGTTPEASFPYVGELEWCGEFRAKEKAS